MHASYLSHLHAVNWKSGLLLIIALSILAFDFTHKLYGSEDNCPVSAWSSNAVERSDLESLQETAETSPLETELLEPVAEYSHTNPSIPIPEGFRVTAGDPDH